MIDDSEEPLVELEPIEAIYFPYAGDTDDDDGGGDDDDDDDDGDDDDDCDGDDDDGDIRKKLA